MTPIHWFSYDDPAPSSVVLTRMVRGKAGARLVWEELEIAAPVIFDSDLMDAEVIVDRAGTDTFTAIDIGLLLGATTDRAARQRALRQKAKGRLPAAAFPGNHQSRDCWSRRQVVEFIARAAVTA